MKEVVKSSALAGYLLAYSENESDLVQWAFQEKRFLPEGSTIWSKLPEKGLHVLRDGDHLTIYSVYRNIPIWEGIIALKTFPPVTEAVFGLKISSEQADEEREAWISWFVKRNPAQLIPAKTSKV